MSENGGVSTCLARLPARLGKHVVIVSRAPAGRSSAARPEGCAPARRPTRNTPALTFLSGADRDISNRPRHWAQRHLRSWNRVRGLPRPQDVTRDGHLFLRAPGAWQKGTVENTNGRLRRFLPLDADISDRSTADLRLLAAQMNATPRKCLGFMTPAEAFAAMVRSCGS